VANPIDAFRESDQRVYVEWLRGVPAGDAALAHAPRAVLVRSGSKAERRLRRDPGFRRVASDPRAALYARVSPHSKPLSISARDVPMAES
jgi:hypothetical protein